MRTQDGCSAINVGLVGVGVVGTGVLDYFADGPVGPTLPGGDLGASSEVGVRLWSAARRSRANPKAAGEDRIRKSVTANGGGPRFFHDAATAPEPAWRSVVHDPEVDIVVELTGSPVAEAIIEEALWNGKCVVTANKAVIARSGHDLVKLARSRGVILAYEAAVGGGMPVVQTIAGALGGRVQAMLAILNGTTNFILSRMIAGDSYQRAVRAAIHGGLAESDPSADVLGDDARSKMMILAGLGFGVRLRPQDVYLRGIARRGPLHAADADRADFHDCPDGQTPRPEIRGDDHFGTRSVFTPKDLAVLASLGLTPKMLAGAQRENGRVVAWAQPAAVPLDHALGGVGGAENGCLLEVESPGGRAGVPFTLALRGPGAGGPETASSVMADVLFCARQLASGKRAADSPPLYMYGADAFREPQAFEGAPALLRADGLRAPFLLRFLLGGGADADSLAALLRSDGVDVEIVNADGADAPSVYFRTPPRSMGTVEEAVRAALSRAEAADVSLDVLYLPIIEGTRWEAS